MNASRLAIALAVLGSFVGGIAVGVFLSGSPASVESVSRSPAVLEPVVAQAPKIVASDMQRGEQWQTESERASEDLHSRFLAALSITDENARHREWLGLIPLLT